MAKVTFSKMKPGMADGIIIKNFMNADGEEIPYEIKEYLPLKDKIELVNNVINQSVDDNGFYNPIRVKLYMTLEIVYAYTNISFTAKQKEDPFKLYDLIVGSSLFDEIITEIHQNDWKEIQENIWHTIDNIYKYRNSAMGILEAVSADYSNLNLDATVIQQKLADPENMALLKGIMEKLG